MVKKIRGIQRRQESLSRERIIEASIALLDLSGEGGLTFRALSRRLATGPGAIYWHIDSKGDLLTAACDAIVIRTMVTPPGDATPEATIRTLSLGLFDAIDAHPWVGSAVTYAPGQLPALRILEALGRQIRALGVPEDKQWTAVSALLHYILGVSGQNAANAEYGRANDIDRSSFLGAVSTTWSELDPDHYPFARSIAGQLRDHDDRVDFLAGINFILSGIGSLRQDRIDPA